jgi:rhodanese-related sulfurtransferase
VFVVSVVALAGVSGPAEAYTDVSVEEARAMREAGAFVLDVRSESEYDEDHIPRAYNIPSGEITSRIDEIDAFQNRDIVVHCQSGGRSATTAETEPEIAYTPAAGVMGLCVAAAACALTGAKALKEK